MTGRPIQLLSGGQVYRAIENSTTIDHSESYDA